MVAAGGGAALDAIPDSAHDHQFESADLLPLALYGVSAGALVLGLMQ